MIPYKMIYTINMHTTVYHHEQSVIDHHARISLYTLSFCTGIRLHVYQFLFLFWITLFYYVNNFPKTTTRHLSVYCASVNTGFREDTNYKLKIKHIMGGKNDFSGCSCYYVFIIFFLQKNGECVSYWTQRRTRKRFEIRIRSNP